MEEMYLELARKNAVCFETLCKEAGIELKILEQSDGVIWYVFDKASESAIQEILNMPVEKRPQERKASLSSQIGCAKNRSRFKNNNKADAVAEGWSETVKEQLEKIENPPAFPTELEKRWAEEKLVEELKQIQSEIEETDALLTSSQESIGEIANNQKRRARKSKGRTHQIMTRLTDGELVQFRRRVRTSGLAQGDFLRTAALTGKIVIEEHNMFDVMLLDEIAMLRAELGRQGGLLKMVIKPNQGQRELASEEWNELIKAIRSMEETKKRLSDMEVKLLDGYRKAHE